MTGEREQEPQQEPARNDETDDAADASRDAPVREVGGPKGLEPTRYGDWERAGRCVDF